MTQVIAPEPVFLSIAQVAERTGTHHTTVRTWIKNGDLRAVQFSDRVIRIPVEALDEMAKPVKVVTPKPQPPKEIEAAQRTVARLLAKYELTNPTTVQMHSVMTAEDFGVYRAAIATLTGIEVA